MRVALLPTEPSARKVTASRAEGALKGAKLDLELSHAVKQAKGTKPARRTRENFKQLVILDVETLDVTSTEEREQT